LGITHCAFVPIPDRDNELWKSCNCFRDRIKPSHVIQTDDKDEAMYHYAYFKVGTKRIFKEVISAGCFSDVKG